MNAQALALVLAGAGCHAAWNILAKRCAGGLVLVWLFGLVSLVPAVPLTLWFWQLHRPAITPPMWGAIGASALLHVLYALALQQGYRASPFSVVYPVARGSGPLLTVLAAVALWGEAPSVLGWASVATVLVGIFLVAGGAHLNAMAGKRELHLGLRWGLATGALVALYTLVDAWCVRSLGMAPLLFYPLSLVLRSVLLTPFVAPRLADARSAWQAHRGAIVGVGVLSPAAYLLALLALQLAPLSYVAPVREISMLIGALVGARLLGEPLAAVRLAGIALMLGGVVGIALA